ncbi:3-oxoacyl-[acyl-carrier protein] reductase [Stenotrophomonas rhizophila]|uniref:3-oxoacyl-[acyl-carrier protein] reductase n=1 Tax=Stenotrophomonas rhizophila TaxID=216778 RepID=A0A498CEY8_9GAMM|nr:glucose 1-dehydrogenase [Stenotrophomonas rhizophila]RLK56396.1 3-oxoacyl-[acyl-carrier protein] reductase [Stenotrophomonas rhizophila]
MSHRLQDKVAFITGAGSGLGAAQAQRFAEEGAAVVVADLNLEAAAKVAAVITEAGGRAIAVMIDVTDATKVASAVAEAIEAYGRVDILSNTAGAFDAYAQTLDTPPERWNALIAVNLTSVYTVTNAVLPHMLAQGKGVVLNIASGAGLRGGGGGAAYTTTKHGIVGYTRQLAAGYGHQGIRANAIAPGLIDTPMVANFSHGEAAQAMVAAKPAGRLGRVEDIAHAALFLVSDEADYIHGVTLPVDGGLVETL